jgi:hypothetical protein
MKFKLLAALTTGLLSAPAFSTPITLDFEGATSFASIDGFYSGGTDGGGVSGANLGVSFGGDALAISNDALGSYYSNAPTPGTVMAPVGSSSTMNVATGFSGTASFYYSSTAATSVGIYSGLDGTGSLLGSFSLYANAQNGCSDSPYCFWQMATVDFAGIAQSIQFGDAANVAGFDDVKVTAVPAPAALWLMMSGLGGLGVFSRRKRAGR